MAAQAEAPALGQDGQTHISSTPTSDSPTPTSTANSSTTNPRSRASTKRIDDILDLGRRRSLAFKETGSPPVKPVMALSPRQSTPTSEQDILRLENESSADEHTAILKRQSWRQSDYQGTRNSLRARNSRSTVAERERRTALAEREDPDGNAHESWWQRQLMKYGSIELENKGSVARDHLALERTFLAWLRTSLAFASIGIAITQLFRLNTTINNGSSGSDPYARLRQLGKPLGATFLGISIVVLFVGFHRYFESQHWIIRGKFPASRGSIAIVAFIAFALMVSSLVVVLVVEPGAYEK